MGPHSPEWPANHMTFVKKVAIVHTVSSPWEERLSAFDIAPVVAPLSHPPLPNPENFGPTVHSPAELLFLILASI